jgi:hypothetical protein
MIAVAARYLHRVRGPALLALALTTGCDSIDDPSAVARLVIAVGGRGFVVVGDSVLLSAVAYDRRGRSVPGVAVAWATREPTRLRVDRESGWAMGLAPTEAVVVATARGHSDSVSVVVSAVFLKRP